MDTLSPIIFAPESRLQFSAGADNSPPKLSGYAMVWGAVSLDRGGYSVRINKGAATPAGTVLALFQHDPAAVLGSTANQTLTLTPDEFGLRADVALPDTQLARDVAALVKRGDVGGMSFRMTKPPAGKFSLESGRKVLNVDPFSFDEVTVTAIPAFVQTAVGVTGKFSQQEQADRIAARLRLERFRFSLPI